MRYKLFDLGNWRDEFAPGGELHLNAKNIDLTRFVKNPVMLDHHVQGNNKEIGSWEDIQVDNSGDIYATANITDEDIRSKVESGEGYQAASVGAWLDKTDLKNLKMTVYEASLVNIGALPNTLNLSRKPATLTDLRAEQHLSLLTARKKNFYILSNLNMDLEKSAKEKNKEKVEEPQKDGTPTTNTKAPEQVSPTITEPPVSTAPNETSVSDADRKLEAAAPTEDAQLHGEMVALKAKYEELSSFVQAQKAERDEAHRKECLELYEKGRKLEHSMCQAEEMPGYFVSSMKDKAFRTDYEKGLEHNQKTQHLNTPSALKTYMFPNKEQRTSGRQELLKEERSLIERIREGNERVQHFAASMNMEQVEAMPQSEFDEQVRAIAGSLPSDIARLKEIKAQRRANKRDCDTLTIRERNAMLLELHARSDMKGVFVSRAKLAEEKK